MTWQPDNDTHSLDGTTRTTTHSHSMDRQRHDIPMLNMQISCSSAVIDRYDGGGWTRGELETKEI